MSMKKKVRSFFEKTTTKVFVVLLVLVVPVNILMVIMNSYVMKSMQEEIHLSVKSVLENYITLLESRMQMGSNLLWRMEYENQNVNAMIKATDEEYYAFYKTQFYYDFLELMELSEGLDTYFFLVRGREDLLLWDEGGREFAAKREFFQNEYGAGSWQRGWSLKNVGGREALCLYVELNNVSYGGWIYLDLVQEQLENDVQYETDVYTFTHREGEERKGTIRISNESGRGDFFLNAYLEKTEIFGDVRAANLYVQLGTMAALFLFPVLYLVIRALLIVPLKTLKIENYEKELERQKMELKNLQLQIRPHFLLNTFNLVFALAKRHENEAIQEIILYLSDYFRYLFRSEKSLELFGREQSLIEGYIKMAQIRYPDSIAIEYKYDPRISFVRLPPLLLHNFVENIVKHVVKKGQLTRIRILGQYEKGIVTFRIMDNGPGILPERVKELDAAMRQEGISGISVGFSNSLKRIKYFYGDGADITITSVMGEGTCILLTIPYDLEEAPSGHTCISGDQNEGGEHDITDCE